MDEPIAEKPERLKSLRLLLRSAIGEAVDALTPPLCVLCQTPTGAGASLCPACWQGLSHIDEPVCDALGTPFAFDEGAGALSPAAIADPPPWRRARAAVAFDESAKRLVHKLKYYDTQEAGLLMARLMTGAGRALLAEADVVVPVPLHRWRLWQRRFNQAAVLAFELARHAGKPCKPEALVRVKQTRQQVGLDAEERQRNVHSAFAVPLDCLAIVDGKSVLVIDDVRTTGATAKAATVALLKAGAAQVDVMTFALVLAPARLHIDV
jgi:ComF family protein